jgi:hypothetical protein
MRFKKPPPVKPELAKVINRRIEQYRSIFDVQ